MRHCHAFLLTSLLLVGLASATEPVDLSPLELSVEERGELTELWVETVLPDGSKSRQRIQTTEAMLQPGRTGRDPAGRAAFATWTEAGQPWSAWSRDAGATWSRPRPLHSELRLHDGATPPNVTIPAVPSEFHLPPGGQVFLVQFRTISLPEWRKALEEAGVEVLGFFPHNAHIVRLPPEVVARAASMEFVQRLEPYHPWYRLERELREWMEQVAENEELRVNVVAFEWGPKGKNRIAGFAESLGARVDANWPNGHIVELSVNREQLRRLAAHDDVMWIDRWSPPETDMDLVREDAGTNWVENNFGYCGQGVRGEVLDSGVQADHQDFDGLLLHGQNNTANHGTEVYGCVFGNGDRDGDGNAQATGHMPCAEQGIFADYSYLGDRFAHTQELKNDPYFASFQTNSWGSSRTTTYTSKSSEMDDIIWRLDIAITQSQSNCGGGCFGCSNPRCSRPQAWAKNIIAVGGIKHKNTLSLSDDCWCSAGSIGPAADGRIKPDVSYWYDSIFTTLPTNSYTSGFGGTSAATPETAGVVGLIVQMWSENVWGSDPQGATVFERQPHASTIKALLVNNAEQYLFSGTTHDLTRVHQGWGRASARRAKERAANSFVVDEEQALEVGQAATYEVNVGPGETELKVTMVYPDPPGTTSSTLHRINDVDLTVFSPSLVTYHGNVGLDASTESSSGGSPNGVDTVENVFVVNPEDGIWTVEVQAVEVNQDAHLATAQDDVVYALVVTGASQSSAPLTPGEAGSNLVGQMLVAGYDSATDVISLAYGVSCEATDTVIYFGELTSANIASYNWSGQECGLGNTGTYDWDTSGLPASLFFVIVGQDDTLEGSYGTDSNGTERLEDTTSTACPRPQDLTNACIS